MSHNHTRQTLVPSHIRPSSSLAHNPSASTQASILQTRIKEKKAELESLKHLRDLSAGLAGQMQQLEQKLATLNDGTEAVAAVLGNWNHVLRAIWMASAKISKPAEKANEEETQLPQTLVRIPVDQAEAAQREAAVASDATGD